MNSKKYTTHLFISIFLASCLYYLPTSSLGSDELHVPPLVEAVQNKEMKNVLMTLEQPVGQDILSLAVEMAVSKGYLEILNVLLEHGAKLPPADGYPLISQAARSGNIAMMTFLKDQGYPVDPADNKFDTATFNAVKSGHLKALEWLIKEEADIDRARRDGKTPLLEAVENDRTEMSKLLIENGAKVTVVDEYKRSLAHLAAAKGNVSILKLLSEKKLSLELEDSSGDRPLNKASRFGKYDVVEFLLSNGVNPDFPGSDGYTALHSAASNGNLEMVKVLVDGGAKMNSKNENGVSPAHSATARHYNRIVRYLANKGASLEKGSNFTLLHEAVFHGNLDIVLFLVKNGIDIDEKNKDGKTAVHMARRNHDTEMVDLLINLGADPTPYLHSPF